jgi:hypothetical protein
MFFLFKLFFLFSFFSKYLCASYSVINKNYSQDPFCYAIACGETLLYQSDPLLHEYFDIVADERLKIDMYGMFNFIIKRALLSFYSLLQDIDYESVPALDSVLPVELKDFVATLSEENTFYWVAFKSYAKSFIEFDKKNKINKRSRLKSPIVKYYNDLYGVIADFHHITAKTITSKQLIYIAVFYINELFWELGDDALLLWLYNKCE